MNDLLDSLFSGRRLTTVTRAVVTVTTALERVGVATPVSWTWLSEPPYTPPYTLTLHSHPILPTLHSHPTLPPYTHPSLPHYSHLTLTLHTHHLTLPPYTLIVHCTLLLHVLLPIATPPSHTLLDCLHPTFFFTCILFHSTDLHVRRLNTIPLMFGFVPNSRSTLDITA